MASVKDIFSKLFSSEDPSMGINPSAKGPSYSDMEASYDKVQKDKEKQKKELEKMRSAQGDYQAREDAKLKEMRAAQGEYQKKQEPGFFDRLLGRQPQNYQTQSSDKFMKDASGKTIYGANNAPIMNPSYDSEAADRKYAQASAEANKPGFFENIKSGVSSFVEKNPNLTSGLIQGAAATGGYIAGRGAAQDQRDIAKDQLSESQRIGENLAQIKNTPQFADLKAQYAKTKALGGMSPELSRALESGKMARDQASQSRMQAVDESMRARGGVSSRGAALGKMYQEGSRAATDISNLEKDMGVEASKLLERTTAAEAELEQKQFQNEQGLAQAKDTMAATRAERAWSPREAQMRLEANQGAATGQFIGGLADVAIGAAGLPSVTQAKSSPTQAPQAQAPQAQAPQAQIPQQRIDAAKQLSQTGTTQKPQTTPAPTTSVAKTPIEQMNQRNTVSTAQAPKPTTPVTQPSASTQPQQGAMQSLMDKGKELYSKIPESQKKQLTDQAMKQGTQFVTGLFKK